MPNHVHLLVETTTPNLAGGMQWLHGTYATRINRRHDRCGHLFQGRYGSVRIESDAQLSTTLAYIARNPVVAGLCRAVREWSWSSHGAVMRGERRGWLDVGRLFSFLSAAGGDPRHRYLQLVEGEREGETTETAEAPPTGPPSGPQRRPDPIGDRRSLGVGRVLRPRPEEPAQPVLPVARHDVHVQMRDRLADDVIGRREDPDSPHRVADRDGERPRSQRKRARELVRKVPQRLVMLLRHEQDVPREERPLVEEREKRRVVEHDVRRE
jgi:hypothetical protein